MSSSATSMHSHDNIFLPKPARIVRTDQPTELEKHFTLRLAGESDMEFAPGQIMEVSLFGYGEIPIGFASSPTRKKSFDIVVRSVGRVSKAINRLNVGDTLYVRGPLGHGFDLEQLRGRDVLIIAGGIGLCPTRSLIQYILDCRSEFKRFILFYGARDPKQQLFLEDLARWRVSKDVEYYETVDSGDPTWKGNVGVITTLFPKVKLDADTRAVICGPPVMFKFVCGKLSKMGVPMHRMFVSLERRMHCGMGKCFRCNVGSTYTCVDGPVFDYWTVMNLKEAI